MVDDTGGGQSSINNYGYAAGLALIMVVAIPVGLKKYYANNPNPNKNMVTTGQQRAGTKSAMEINRAAKSQIVENSGNDAAAIRAQRVTEQQPVVRVPGAGNQSNYFKQGAARNTAVAAQQPKANQMPDMQQDFNSGNVVQPKGDRGTSNVTKGTGNSVMTKGTNNSFNANTNRKGGR